MSVKDAPAPKGRVWRASFIRGIKGFLRPRNWWGGCLIALLWLLNRLTGLKVAAISADRIGHFAADAAIQAIRFMADPKPQRLIVGIVDKPPINAFWMELLERSLPVRAWISPAASVLEKLPTAPTWYSQTPRSESRSRDLNGDIGRAQSFFKFSPAEHTQSLDALKRFGWRVGQPFVCLMIRDSAYMNYWAQGPGRQKFRDRDWSYHSFRNTNLESYRSAVRWLCDNDIFVLRMGRVVEKPFPLSHKNFFDYALSSDASDFLDVWLFATTDLCISTSTGPDMIPSIFGKPKLEINFSPMVRARTDSRAMFAPQLLTDEAGRYLSFADCFNVPFRFRTQDYMQNGLSFRPLIAAEIRSITEEAWAWAQGSHPHPRTLKRLRKEFISRLEQSDFAPANLIHPEAVLSVEWEKALRRAGGRPGLNWANAGLSAEAAAKRPL